MRYITILLPGFLAGCGAKRDGWPVTIYAASSLREAVTEFAVEWSRRSGRPHRLQFEATATLARQIREGAPADLFIAAAPEWVDRVEARERFDWLSNRLVVVVRKEEASVDLRTLDSLALANEQVPAGKYARQALARAGIRVPPRTVYGQNVRDVLSKVSQGGARAGIVYATDAAIEPEVRIAHTFPRESHDRIVYSVALLQPAGRELFDALREPWALAVALRRGFEEVR